LIATVLAVGGENRQSLEQRNDVILKNDLRQ
jgi:hypothetical protein